MSVEQLTLKQLRALVAVYRTRQISAAARHLNLTQSAVSVLIRQTEAALGIQLFDRTTRSVVPTRAGENAYGIAERILDDVKTLAHTMSDLHDLRRGTVRVAATPATGVAMLPKTVQRFRADYPGVRLVLDDCAPNQFIEVVRDEKVDLGVGVPPPVHNPEFDTKLVLKDELMLICATSHSLATKPRVEWRDLANQPLILSRQDYGVRNQVEAALQRVGARPEVVAEIGFLTSASWLAACDIGVSVMPRQLAELHVFEGVAVRLIESPVLTRGISVVTKKSRALSPASAIFVDYLLEDWRVK